MVADVQAEAVAGRLERFGEWAERLAGVAVRWIVAGKGLVEVAGYGPVGCGFSCEIRDFYRWRILCSWRGVALCSGRK